MLLLFVFYVHIDLMHLFGWVVRVEHVCKLAIVVVLRELIQSVLVHYHLLMLSRHLLTILTSIDWIRNEIWLDRGMCFFFHELFSLLIFYQFWI